MIPEELLKLIVCPQCKGELEYKTENEKNEWLICHKCRLRFPVVDDIPVLRLDKAESLDQNK